MHINEASFSNYTLYCFIYPKIIQFYGIEFIIYIYSDI